MRIKYDNKFFNLLGNIINVLWISVLWLFFSLPIITIGASSTALYYTTHKIIFKSEGYIFQTYMDSFKENFKQATIKWIISIVAISFLGVDIWIARNVISPENIMAGIYWPILIVLIFVIMCQFTIFAYGARFNDEIIRALKKSIVITASELGWALFLLIMLSMALYICRFLVFLVIILPGGFSCLMHHCYEHIFEKYGWIDAE